MKKVSVIVPVYNVEKYLRKCVESIKNQTYRNLEIILVDDGSPDNCGEICDELAKLDSRIRVIHKENGGLSDARNAGMDISTGDYIGFVDSDDYVDEDFYEILVANLEKYNADISCCRYNNVWIDGELEAIGNDGSIRVFLEQEGLREYLLAKEMDPFVCNKLYDAKILGNKKYGDKHLRFIKGIFGEDIPFNIDVFMNSPKTVQIGLSKYNYLQLREGAITYDKVTQKRIDSVYRWEGYRKKIRQKYPELEKYALRRQTIFYVGLYNRTYDKKQYKNVTNTIRLFAQEHNKEIQESEIFEKTIKYSVSLLARSPKLYEIIMKGYKKIVGRARL